MHSLNLSEIFQELPISPENECSYYPDRKSTLKYAILAEDSLTPSVVEEFTNRGYRRSGGFYYSTVCQKCRMCIPYRVPLQKLQFSRSQRKVLQKNSQIQVHVVSPKPSTEKEAMYIRYIRSRHPENFKSVRHESKVLDTMHHQMYSVANASWELEFYDQDKLAGFGILDVGEKSASAVYHVYDPDYESQSFGTFMILKSMDWLRSENLFTYYHLGFWIPGHPKMDYKKNFRPGEILHPITKTWVPAEVIIS